MGQGALPLILAYRNRVEVSGVLDTGSAVNVLPYGIGTRLGAIWEEQTISLVLAGNLTPVEARGLVVGAQIGDFPAVRLAFAWCQSDAMSRLVEQLRIWGAI